MVRKKSYVIAAALILVLAGGLAFVKVRQIQAMIAAGESFVMPPETVSGARVARVHWEKGLSAVGTVTPVQGVLLRTEVSGLVKRIAFESGAVVSRGQVLVELDRAAEEAQLRTAEARAELARTQAVRARDLHAQQVLSRADLDAAEATFSQTTADVDGFRVAISKKTIRAPFSGRVGIREIHLGQFADAGTAIAPLQSLDPVHVDFSLPEQQVSRIVTGMRVRVTSDAAAGRIFEGPLTAINPEVDASSRSIRLQATLTGTDGALLPGMFARAEIVLSDEFTPLVIPVTSVLKAPYGDSVFVIAESRDEKTGKVAQRVRMSTVSLGETRGDLVVVEKGLKEGQLVASSGVFKLRNDAEVALNDTLAPSAEAQPHPANS